jgi:hypothetical protein
MVTIKNYVQVLCAALLLDGGNAFLGAPRVAPLRRRANNLGPGQLGMAAVASSKDSKASTFPRDVKDAVSKCRASVQEALQKKSSRMDVEFPVGADFGVEKKSSRGKGKGGNNKGGEEGVNKGVLDRSDRELCRIFVEMFQPLGRESISAVFVDEALADEARESWENDSSSGCQVLTTGRRRVGGKKVKPKKKKTMGFAAKLNAELDLDTSKPSTSGPFRLPDKCELALFVSPGPKELVIIEKICNEVGMGTLIVLLNARLGSVDRFHSDAAEILFTDEFEPVFHLAAAPQDAAPNCLMHRAYPSDWILARKPKVGQPKVIGSQAERFTPEECKVAYENIEIGDMEGTVEGVLENVANWFK